MQYYLNDDGSNERVDSESFRPIFEKCCDLVDMIKGKAVRQGSGGGAPSPSPGSASAAVSQAGDCSTEEAVRRCLVDMDRTVKKVNATLRSKITLVGGQEARSRGGSGASMAEMGASPSASSLHLQDMQLASDASGAGHQQQLLSLVEYAVVGPTGRGNGHGELAGAFAGFGSFTGGRGSFTGSLSEAIGMGMGAERRDSFSLLVGEASASASSPPGAGGGFLGGTAAPWSESEAVDPSVLEDLVANLRSSARERQDTAAVLKALKKHLPSGFDGESLTPTKAVQVRTKRSAYDSYTHTATTPPHTTTRNTPLSFSQRRPQRTGKC